MTAKNSENERYSDNEAERRATEALRRALTTPYKPQRELVGVKKRVSPKGKKSHAKSAPKGPESDGA
jgi:hypothetical protein